MNFKSILKIGDRVTIVDEFREYNTSVDDVIDEWTFSLLQPFDKGRAIDLEPGKGYQITCVKSGGLHRFEAMAMNSEISGRVKINYFRYIGNYFRIQRRNAFRCQMMLDVEVRKPISKEREQSENDWVQTRTMDVSETGMRVRMSSHFGLGDPVECIIKIDKYGIDAFLPTITGHVVRTIPLPGRKDEIICGVKFDDIDSKSRNMLLKLVALGQRNRINP